MSRSLDDAATALALFATDPVGLGGIVLRARAGPVRTCWLERLHAVLPPALPVRRLPPGIDDNRLLGGLDLAATMKAGRPVLGPGFLAETAGGVVLVPMAERVPPALAGRLAAALEGGVGFGMVALDEGVEADERPPLSLSDRLALHLGLENVGAREPLPPPPEPEVIATARVRLPAVMAGDEALEALTSTAVALGIASLRAPLLALRAARAAAALAGRGDVSGEDVALAARLVLAPRATRLPADEVEAPSPEPQSPSPEAPPADGEAGEGRLQDVVLAAAQAAVPADLLARLQAGAEGRRAPRDKGAGAPGQGARRGRPAGVRRGRLHSGARLDLVETLRAAAPWQTLRRAAEPGREGVRIHPDDIRLTRFKQRRESVTLFVVDASGSAALHRLAEAKGAVERLLADCYVRRDQVALIAFRGSGAHLLLPPTRSLARAKRELAGLPGGGGTPLAAGITAALTLADAARRQGRSPTAVFLTDGRANIAADGSPGRPGAEGDARRAAARLRAAGVAALLIDTAPRPYPFAREVAGLMAARYVTLPLADAGAVSRAVRAAIPA